MLTVAELYKLHLPEITPTKNIVRTKKYILVRYYDSIKKKQSAYYFKIKLRDLKNVLTEAYKKAIEVKFASTKTSTGYRYAEIVLDDDKNICLKYVIGNIHYMEPVNEHTIIKRLSRYLYARSRINGLPIIFKIDYRKALASIEQLKQ